MIQKAIKLFRRSPEYFFIEVKRRMMQKFTYYTGVFQRGYSFTLRTLSLVPTLRCNQNCIMCESFLRYSERFSKDLVIDLDNPSYFKKIILETSSYKPDIVLTGGEVLLYERWDEIASYAKSLKLKIILETNGSLLEENAPEIVRFVDVLCVSLDSPYKEKNDKIRGMDGSYEKVINGISKINKFKKTPKIYINFTILNENYREIEEMAKFAQELKIEKLRFLYLLFTDGDTIKKHKEDLEKRFQVKTDIFLHRSYIPNNFDLNYLIEKIKKVKDSFLVDFFPDFEPIELKNYYLDSKYIPKRFSKCLNPYFEAIVIPDCNLMICPGYNLGSIKEQSFKEIWNNDKARIFRKSLLKDGILPNCRGCGGIYAN